MCQLKLFKFLGYFGSIPTATKEIEQNLPVSLLLHSGFKPWGVAYFDPKKISKNRYQMSDIRNAFRSVSWTLTNLGSICKWKQLTQPASLTLVLCT